MADTVEKPAPLNSTTPMKFLRRTWIEFVLKDDEGNGLVDWDYACEAPNGKTEKGKLDADGKGRVEGIPPGTCIVKFKPPKAPKVRVREPEVYAPPPPAGTRIDEGTPEGPFRFSA